MVLPEMIKLIFAVNFPLDIAKSCTFYIKDLNRFVHDGSFIIIIILNRMVALRGPHAYIIRLWWYLLFSLLIQTQLQLSFNGQLVRPNLSVAIPSAPVERNDDMPLASRRPPRYNKWLKEPMLFKLIVNTIKECEFKWTVALQRLRAKDHSVFSSLSTSTMREWFLYDGSDPDKPESKRWSLTPKAEARVRMSSMVSSFITLSVINYQCMNRNKNARLHHIVKQSQPLTQCTYLVLM